MAGADPNAKGSHMEKTNPRLGDAFKKVIQNQLRSGKPPITRETLGRLLKEGIAESEAVRLMACVMACETWSMMHDQREFSLEEYSAMMRKLPELPE
jgi:hypothetical protein